MAGDTALFFSLSWDDAAVVARIGSTALAEHRDRNPNDSWEIEWLLEALSRAEGDGGITVAGTVSKAPDVDWIIESLSGALVQVFSAMPEARAQIWIEGYEGADDGSVVYDMALPDEETSGPSQVGLEVREHFIPAGLLQHEEEIPGAKEPDWDALGTRIALFFEWHDDRELIPIARKHLDKVMNDSGSDDPAKRLAARLLRDKLNTTATEPNLGPKGGMSVWGAHCDPVDVAQLATVLRPFLKEVCSDNAGAILVYQAARGTARCCRLGWTEVGDSRRFEVRHHALPFGLAWSPAVLSR